MRNATGKESRHFDEQEIRLIAQESLSNGAPAWVSRALLEQVEDIAE